MFMKTQKSPVLNSFSTIVAEGISIVGDLISTGNPRDIIVNGDVGGKISTTYTVVINGQCSAREIIASKVVINGFLTCCDLIRANLVEINSANKPAQCITEIQYRAISITEGSKLKKTQLNLVE